MFDYTSFCIDEDIVEYKLDSFFAKQLLLSNISTVEWTYRDEFEAMSLLYGDILDEPINLIHRTTIELLKGKQKLEENNLKSNVGKRIQKTRDLRQKGNRLFNASKNDSGDKAIVLMACHFYTSAIWAALDTNNEELALGFSNRGKALQTYGYYQQAYDDYVFALNLNYPVSKRHKIIKRQTYCCIKSKDFSKAEKHLKELQYLSMNKDNDIELQKLLQLLEENKRNINDESKVCTGVKDLELITKIKECFITGKGRGMETTCTIKENEFIFSDRALAFIPNDQDSSVCHQCGAIHFIPIPCLNCRGRVKYCSLKCQQEHSKMHAYECLAFRCNFFNNTSALLVLRMLFDNGIFATLKELQLDDDKISTSKIWCNFREGGKIWENRNLSYAKLLRMITHFSKNSLFEQKSLILLVNYSVTYLKLFTNCFEILNTKNNLINWELLVASLMLLHHGQKMANVQSLFAITIIPSKLTTQYPYSMLNANLWQSPCHLKLGKLHFFSNIGNTGSLILPNYSLCNHACNQVFQIKFCGRLIRTYALHNIEKDEELTTCYTPDYRQQKQKTRLSNLKEKFHFDCKCKHCCNSDNEDVEFNKFNQYRCDNSKCGQIFIPLENQIKWYLDMSPLNCTICGHKQLMKEFYEISHLYLRSAELPIRRCLYGNFMKLKENYLELNEARCKCAKELVFGWFMESQISLNDQDYIELIDMLKYALNFTEAQQNKISHEYLVLMTYLWDLIALRKYEATKMEMDEMLNVIDIILDDNTKDIFLNYYNDYINEYLENKNL